MSKWKRSALYPPCLSHKQEDSLRWASHSTFMHKPVQRWCHLHFCSPLENNSMSFPCSNFSLFSSWLTSDNKTIVCLPPSRHSESLHNWRVGRVKDKACSAWNMPYPSPGTPGCFSPFWGENYCTHHTGKLEYPTRSPRWSTGRGTETGHPESASPASSNAPLQTWFRLQLMSHSMVSIGSHGHLSERSEKLNGSKKYCRA